VSEHASQPPSPRLSVMQTGVRDVSHTPFVRMSDRHRLMIVVGYAVFYLMVTGLAISNPAPNHPVLLVGLFVFMAVNLLPILVFRRRWGWFHPLVVGSVLLLPNLLKKLGMFGHGLEWHRALPDYGSGQLNELVAFELVLNAVGMLAYFTGFYFARNVGVPRLTLHRPRNLKPVVLCCIALSLVVFLFYVSQRGGILSHFTETSRNRHVSIAGEHYIIRFTAIGSLALLIWLAFDRRAEKSALFWLCVVLAVPMSFVLTGSRGAMLYQVGVGLVVYMLREHKLVLFRLLLMAIVGIYLIGVLGDLRRSSWSGEVDLETVTETSFSEGLQTGREEIVRRGTSSSGALAIYARVPGSVDFLYGESYLALLTLPVPRGLWPDKPGLIGGRVGRTFFGTVGGIPPSAAGEAYWNFHIPGVLVVFALFGVFHRWLARLRAAYPRQPAVLVVYAITIFYLANPSTSAVAGFLSTAAMTLAILAAIGAFRLKRGRVIPSTT